MTGRDFACLMPGRGRATVTSRKTRKTARVFAKVVATRLGLSGPIHLSHLVTGRCDCRCPTCIWRDNTVEELDTETIESLYRGAGEAGLVAKAIWGGEPLLREDLPRLCRASRDAGLITTVITNGYLLPDRARELSGEIHSLIVSIDYPDSGRHDSFRGKEDIFERAVEGIEILRRLRAPQKIIVNCLLHRGNEGLMEEMARLAVSLGVSLYVCPAKEGTLLDTGQSNREALAQR